MTEETAQSPTPVFSSGALGSRVTAWVCDGTPTSLANLRVEVRVRELAKWEDRH